MQLILVGCCSLGGKGFNNNHQDKGNATTTKTKRRAPPANATTTNGDTIGIIVMNFLWVVLLLLL
jgi:hypothetical protein